MSFTPQQSPNLREQREAANRVKDDPRPNFVLVVHPLEWKVHADGHMLPTITAVGKQVGTGAVDRDGDFALEQRRLEKQGLIVIPHDVLGPDADYVAPYLNRKGKTVCRSIFQVGYTGPGGETLWQHDREAYVRFVELLIRRGLIPPPTPQVISGMRVEQEQRIKFLASRRPSELHPELVERHQQQVSAAQRALDVLTDAMSAAEQHYGKPRSQGRDLVLAALDAADAEDLEGASPTPSRYQVSEQEAEIARLRAELDALRAASTPSAPEPQAAQPQATEPEAEPDDDGPDDDPAGGFVPEAATEPASKPVRRSRRKPKGGT